MGKMDTQNLLEQLLRAGKDLAGQGQDMLEQKFGVPEAGEQREAMLSGAGKGAMAAGALALLLGTGAGRRLSGAALRLGSLAAVGGLGYKAYKNWQGQQGTVLPEASAASASELSGQQATQRSMMLLKAMIAAAKADGHIDEAERAKIMGQMQKLEIEPAAARFMEDEMAKPLDVKAIAATADGPEVAAEIYLVSRLVIDETNTQEKAYLNDLAQALGLAPELVGELESQVAA